MAEKTLVVVESPAKAKTINKYLGSKYIVEASVGHVKDLITYRLGVDVENDFQPKYVTIRGKADVIKKLNKLASGAAEVLIATDPDREGEAIAWHIAEEVKKKNKNVRRVLFNEITKSGIKKGLAEPLELNENLFMSQQARRVMDRLIGYKVSPFLSRAMIEKTDKALSAGRVQSVALRLICEREEQIVSFVPIDYWNITALFGADENIVNAKLFSIDGENLKNPEGSKKGKTQEEQKAIDKKLSELNYIKSAAKANELVSKIEKENFSITSINKKQIRRKPNAPFTTSNLQQEASKRLGFSNKKTMMVAQRLYEGIEMGEDGMVGLITYMRTDSTRVSPESQNAAREQIVNVYGKDYLPAEIPEYATKSKGIQDAHEAIRPTVISYTPETVKKYCDRDLAKLYELIYNRFLASQMSPAEIDQTSVNIEGGEFLFRATGSVITFKGFLKVYDDFVEDNENNGKESNKLPLGLTEDMPMPLNNTEAVASQTKPLPRFNEASLVKELDDKGIGRPSTYASIISTLVDRQYVELSKKVFFPTELGGEVTQILVKNFPNLFNVKFTAVMEDNLDTVATGDRTYVGILKEFYKSFTDSLEYAEEHSDIPEIKCEKCDGSMVIRVSRRGRFLGCSNYPDCTNTKPLPTQEKKAKEEPKIAEGVFCDKCKSPMIFREGKFGRFYGCSNYPECDGIKPISTEVKCPKCSEGTLVERSSKKAKKKFWGCSNYPKCDYLTNHEPLNRKCTECGHYYLEVRFKKVDTGYEKYISCPECKATFVAE